MGSLLDAGGWTEASSKIQPEDKKEISSQCLKSMPRLEKNFVDHGKGEPKKKKDR